MSFLRWANQCTENQGASWWAAAWNASPGSVAPESTGSVRRLWALTSSWTQQGFSRGKWGTCCWWEWHLNCVWKNTSLKETGGLFQIPSYNDGPAISQKVPVVTVIFGQPKHSKSYTCLSACGSHRGLGSRLLMLYSPLCYFMHMSTGEYVCLWF